MIISDESKQCQTPSLTSTWDHCRRYETWSAAVIQVLSAAEAALQAAGINATHDVALGPYALGLEPQSWSKSEPERLGT